MKNLFLIAAFASIPIFSAKAATVNFTINLPPTSTTGAQIYYGIVSYNQNLAPTVGNSILTIGDDPSITILLSFHGLRNTSRTTQTPDPFSQPSISLTERCMESISSRQTSMWMPLRTASSRSKVTRKQSPTAWTEIRRKDHSFDRTDSPIRPLISFRALPGRRTQNHTSRKA